MKTPPKVRITIEYLDGSQPTKSYEVDSVEVDPYLRDGWHVYSEDDWPGGPAIAYLPARESRVKITGFTGPAVHRNEGDLKEIRVDAVTAEAIIALEKETHLTGQGIAEEKIDKYLEQLEALIAKGSSWLSGHFQ